MSENNVKSKTKDTTRIKEAVKRAVGLVIHKAPHKAHDDGCDHHWQDEKGAQYGHAADVAIQQQGEAHADDHLCDNDGEGEYQGDGEAFPKAGVHPQSYVVLEADKLGLTDALAGIPIAETAPDHVADGVE